MFTCCHPALSFEAQVALTLRTLAGMTTAEIARAFLVPEPTMAQRLVRAKRKIRHAGIPFVVPPAHQLVERTAAVLAVLYLLFNEGYSASSGADLVRRSLTAEAIRLVRVLCTLMPDEPEALGLLALMLFHDARSAARVDGDGDLWSWRSRTARCSTPPPSPRGTSGSVPRCGSDGRGPSRSRRPSRPATSGAVGETDWAEIAALYDHLFDMAPSAVVELNRAVAVSMSEGPEAGLALIERIAPDGLPRVPPASGGPGRHAAAARPPGRGRPRLPRGA